MNYICFITNSWLCCRYEMRAHFCKCELIMYHVRVIGKYAYSRNLIDKSLVFITQIGEVNVEHPYKYFLVFKYCSLHSRSPYFIMHKLIRARIKLIAI